MLRRGPAPLTLRACWQTLLAAPRRPDDDRRRSHPTKTLRKLRVSAGTPQGRRRRRYNNGIGSSSALPDRRLDHRPHPPGLLKHAPGPAREPRPVDPARDRTTAGSEPTRRFLDPPAGFWTRPQGLSEPHPRGSEHPQVLKPPAGFRAHPQVLDPTTTRVRRSRHAYLRT